jgi:hypothetical protein
MIWHSTTLVILSGQTASSVLTTADSGYTRNMYKLLFVVPAAVTETVVVQVSADNVTYVNLQSGGADIPVPGGKATQLCGVITPFLRLLSGTAVGADRTITVLYGAE